MPAKVSDADTNQHLTLRTKSPEELSEYRDPTLLKIVTRALPTPIWVTQVWAGSVETNLAFNTFALLCFERVTLIFQNSLRHSCNDWIGVESDLLSNTLEAQ